MYKSVRFFSSKLIVGCTNLKRNWFVQDYTKFTNLTNFGPKVVQLEVKTIVNIGNNFWMVLRLYPQYINDCNSHFKYILLPKISEEN